ncbi:endonuclease/exonuclease/phosphatase family protein [Patulibacter sp. NPDC049589]|uniref:endonuclease/exonuclease/phosphatase family protein n=1 Tax=Patulibacter sp. NPDC049589 TaxID=3154731 RepID=UPI0034442806
MRVLTWNLFHGRAVPPAGRPLLHEFAATLAGWEWDVALLQEVPPWWPPLLARACGADARTVLTSRNALLPLRRAIASRRPDLLRSNGGGADSILVRPPLRIAAHARRRLRVWPERRVVHAVLVDGMWVGNVHAEPPHPGETPGPAGPPLDVALALGRMEAWATGSGPVLLGGDLNLRPAAVDATLPTGWSRLASRDVDHLLGRGVVAAGPSSRPDRGPLSDHPALAVDVAIPAAPD